MKLAISGKGGVGKTTFSALLAQAYADGGRDVLAVDAFSGDAIPIHLLTKEAAAIYFRHLKPDGILALHITNLHFDLEAVAHGLAKEFGKSIYVVRQERDSSEGIKASTWALITDNREFLDHPRVLRYVPESSRGIDEDAVLWTDDHSDVLGALRD